MTLLPADEYRKTRGIIRRGTRSAQPVANTVLEGTIYFVTDEGVIERSNGSVWESYSGSSGSGQQGLRGFNGLDGIDGENTEIILLGQTPIGKLLFSGLIQASAANKLIGRGSASGGGDFQEIDIGVGLSLSGTTLKSTGGFNAGVFSSGTQAISHATMTSITFANEQFDNGGMHSNVTNNSRITVPTGGAGIYFIAGYVQFATNSVGVRHCRILKNGITGSIEMRKQAVVSDQTTMQAFFIDSLSDGDYNEFQVYQESGGNLNIGDVFNNYFFMAKIG